MAKKQEKDPNGKNPKEMGAKLDAGKAPIMQGVATTFLCPTGSIYGIFSRSQKYAWRGWEEVPGWY